MATTLYRNDVELFMAKQLDYAGRTDGQPVYEGWAQAGTATSGAFWTIKKNFYDGNNMWVYCQWADGNTLPDNVWDGCSGLTFK